MDKTRILIVIGLVVIVITGIVIALTGGQDELDEAGGSEVRDNVYVNDDYDFSFGEMEGYEILEVEDPVSHRFTVVMSRAEDTNIPEGGEGAPAITVDVFDNIDIESLESWLGETMASNYSLIMGESKETSVGSEQALAYEWDGLYRGQSVVFEHEGRIILISGTYLEKTDPIYSDFDEVVESFELF